MSGHCAESASHPAHARAKASGDIAAIVGIKNITTGDTDTLCDEDHPILLEPPSFPDPVISMAIEPKTKLDQEKMATALQRLAEEDEDSRLSRRPYYAERSRYRS